MSDVSASSIRADPELSAVLVHEAASQAARPQSNGLTLPETVFPRFPEALRDPGPEMPPQKRKWSGQQIYRKMRGWLFPYVRSRLLPGDFHPITAYLFVEYKCNLDCWYCWAFGSRCGSTNPEPVQRLLPLA